MWQGSAVHLLVLSMRESPAQKRRAGTDTCKPSFLGMVPYASLLAPQVDETLLK